MRINHQKAVLILCAAAILLIPVLRSAVLPFALALFLAGCFQRPMAKLEKRHIPRWLSSLAILLIGLAPLLLLLGYGILSLAHSVGTSPRPSFPGCSLNTCWTTGSIG